METWPAVLYNHRKWQLIGKSQCCCSVNAVSGRRPSLIGVNLRNERLVISTNVVDFWHVCMLCVKGTENGPDS